MRRWCAAVAVVLVAGCGVNEDKTVHLPALRIKLDALATDTCHTRPRDFPPSDCAKYVTQLANTARTVAAAGRANAPGLGDPGRRMTSAVGDYQAGGCQNEHQASEEDCYAALETIARAVADAQAELEETEA